jgi:AcrR family transcriptional regulator
LASRSAAAAATGNQRRQRRARGSITPEEVIRGAFELAEAEGVEALSMPRLAQALDVGVTSIYWYFKSKDDLLGALSAEAFRRFYAAMPPLAGREWDDVLREFFRNFRALLRNDDVVCDLTIMRGASHTDETLLQSWERIEEILEVLVAAGFSEESATSAYFTLSVYTRGCLFIERSMRVEGRDVSAPGHPRAHLSADLPVLSKEMRKRSWYMVDDETFEFGLENHIRGLRAVLAADREASGAV